MTAKKKSDYPLLVLNQRLSRRKNATDNLEGILRLEHGIPPQKSILVLPENHEQLKRNVW